jgi:lysophospholipase L1-like esterase
MKKVIFYCILLLPAIVLSIVACLMSYDIYVTRNVSINKVNVELKKYLNNKPAITFRVQSSVSKLKKGKKNIFVFGESSLVITDGNTFTNYLNKYYNDINAINLGVAGIESQSLKKRIDYCLNLAEPDMVVLYFGHNDYNMAYHNSVLSNFFSRFDLLTRIAYVLHDKTRRTDVIWHQDLFWYSRLFRPVLYDGLNRIGLLNLDTINFDDVNNQILHYYIQNTEAILNSVSRKNIPVIIITPIGNLAARPYGGNKTHLLYSDGIKEPYYYDSVRLLKEARDKEFMTYDIRAKTALLNYIRGIKKNNVFILDLESELESRHFNFDYTGFIDYFHFNDKTHQLISHVIHDYLKKNELLLDSK